MTQMGYAAPKQTLREVAGLLPVRIDLRAGMLEKTE